MCRRRGTSGGWIGIAMVSGGIIALGVDSFLEGISWGRLGVLLVVCGAMVMNYLKLKQRTEGNSETYSLGYDIGYEAGYQEARSLTRPVVVDLDARRAHESAIK